MSALVLMSRLEKYLQDDENFGILEAVLEEKTAEYHALGEKLDFGEKLTPRRLKEIAPTVEKEVRNFLQIEEAVPVRYALLYGLNTTAKTTIASVVSGLCLYGIFSQMNDHEVMRDVGFAAVSGLLIGSWFPVRHLAEDSHYKPGIIPRWMNRYASKLRSIPFIGGKITLKDERTVSVAGIIGHEYTHHLQKIINQPSFFSSMKTVIELVKDITSTGFPMLREDMAMMDFLYFWKQPMSEGHARGVEGKICYHFAEKYENPAYVQGYLQRTISDLQHAYLYTCRKRGMRQKERLTQLGAIKKEIVNRVQRHHYSIGTAVIAVAERKHGEQIYRDALRRDYSFLRLAQ